MNTDTAPGDCGTLSGTFEFGSRTAVTVIAEHSGTFQRTLLWELFVRPGMASTSQIEESELPWKTAPEHAREILRALDFEEDSQTWKRSVEYATKYGLRGSLGTGHRPSSIGAGSVYVCVLLFNDGFTQREVAAASQSSEPALRNAYHEIAVNEGFRYRSNRDDSPGSGGDDA